MSQPQVITHPNEILRKMSREIEPDFFNQEQNKKLITDMIETMYRDDGIGLAAPQVGKNIRLVVISKQAAGSNNELILINPLWRKLSRKKISDIEGCLSLPKTFGKVKRYKKIQVRAIDQNEKKITFSAEDMLARVIQHEVDHLNGILFIDKAKDIYREK